jgi:hypothetical protein
MECELNDGIPISMLHRVISALRKIGDDIVIDVTADAFTLRSLNQTHSALPIVHFKVGFFSAFCYRADSKSIVYQLPVAGLIAAFKNVTAPTSLRMAVDTGLGKFTLGLTDKFGILHDWELFLGKTVLLNAMYDISDATVEIQCRCDVFDGLAEAFKGNHNVFLGIARTDGSLVFTSSRDSDMVLSSTLSIRKSERCETLISPDVDELKVQFALGDFAVAVKIVSVLSQRMSMYLVGPGMPVIIKAGIPNQVVFEMPLATSLEEEPEEEPQPDVSATESSLVDAQPEESPASQVSPWPRRRSVQTETPAGEASVGPPSAVGDPRPAVQSRASDFRHGLYSESPPFPLRRRMTGQYAEASQPPSDDSDSDP